MPHRHQVAGVNALLLFTFVLATLTSVLAVSNSLQARDNCRRVSRLNAETRHVLEESLDSLKKGESDDDYRRFFGPDWQERKQNSIDRLEVQVARFGELDCTVTIIRWIKGD